MKYVYRHPGIAAFIATLLVLGSYAYLWVTGFANLPWFYFVMIVNPPLAFLSAWGRINEHYDW